MADVVEAVPIRTERLVLRSLRSSDAEPLFAEFAHWAVIRWLSMPPWPYTLDDAHSYIRSLSDEKVAKSTFAITRDDALIGCVDVRISPVTPVQREPGPHIGYWLGCPYWGRGYMTEAVRGLLHRVFAANLGDTIYSGAFIGNIGSLRVQEKIGFMVEWENALYSRPQGKELPHVSTELTRSAFYAASTRDGALRDHHAV